MPKNRFLWPLAALLVTAAATPTVEKLLFEAPLSAAVPAAETPQALREPGSEERFDSIITEYASRYRVDPALVKAVIRAESGFDPRVVSRRGARGLMQLMPPTARSHGVRDLRDPRENIHGGVRHLRSLLDRFHGDNRLAVAAYNAGSRSVARYGGLPPFRETRAYVARVLRFRERYRMQTASFALARSG